MLIKQFSAITRTDPKMGTRPLLAACTRACNIHQAAVKEKARAAPALSFRRKRPRPYPCGRSSLKVQQRGAPRFLATLCSLQYLRVSCSPASCLAQAWCNICIVGRNCYSLLSTLRMYSDIQAAKLSYAASVRSRPQLEVPEQLISRRSYGRRVSRYQRQAQAITTDW